MSDSRNWVSRRLHIALLVGMSLTIMLLLPGATALGATAKVVRGPDADEATNLSKNGYTFKSLELQVTADKASREVRLEMRAPVPLFLTLHKIGGNLRPLTQGVNLHPGLVGYHTLKLQIKSPGTTKHFTLPFFVVKNNAARGNPVLSKFTFPGRIEEK